jgi:hypothetical protein
MEHTAAATNTTKPMKRLCQDGPPLRGTNSQYAGFEKITVAARVQRQCRRCII